MVRVRLDAPQFTRYVYIKELRDLIVVDGKKFRRDVSMYKTWKNPRTYSLSEE